jgi:hypothetical protein
LIKVNLRNKTAFGNYSFILFIFAVIKTLTKIDMATVTLNYDASNALALSVLDVIKRTDAFTIVKEGGKAKSALSVSF